LQSLSQRKLAEKGCKVGCFYHSQKIRAILLGGEVLKAMYMDRLILDVLTTEAWFLYLHQGVMSCVIALLTKSPPLAAHGFTSMGSPSASPGRLLPVPRPPTS
jgi:hypothetical protein